MDRISRKAAGGDLSIPALLRTASALLEEVLHHKQATASIRLYDARRQVLRFEPEWHETFHSRIDVPAEKDRTNQRLHEGVCGQVANKVLDLAKTCWHEDDLMQCYVNAGNVEENPFYLKLISNTRSELVVPIYRKDEHNLILVGVLDLQSPELNAFTEEDRQLVNFLSAQLAVIIQNTQAYEREKRRANIREILSEASKVVNKSRDLAEILDHIARLAGKLMEQRGEQVCYVELRRIIKDKGKHVLATAYPPEILPLLQASEWVELDIESGINGKIGLIGLAIKTKKEIVAHDVTAYPEHYLAQTENTKSEVVILRLLTMSKRLNK